MDHFWTQPAGGVLKSFGTDAGHGLTSSKARENRIRYGANEIEAIRPAGAFDLILEGVREPMMIVLLAIGGFSLLFGKTAEAVVMIFVVAAYIAVEFVNKYRTDRTMTHLRKLTSPTARVIRDGEPRYVAARDVVCGDILILTEGLHIPADARLIESFGLSLGEASLTGESLPVEKMADAVLDANTPLAERCTMIFAGTTVFNGEGKAIVTAVGAESELGKIAGGITRVGKERTVLQEAMTRLAKILALFAVGVSIVIPAIGFLRGLGLQEMIVTWLALTFLMIPGQPPIIITMALALASFKLASIKLVVKRLRGVESLSQVTAIVTDKTGTITENTMRAERFILPTGEAIPPDALGVELKRSILHALPHFSNDPTDEAVRFAVGDFLEIERPVAFGGFSEDQPWRMIEYEVEGKRIHYIAGRTESVLENAGMDGSRILAEVIQEATINGKRVVAYGRTDGPGGGRRVSLLALAVLSDPVRAGVAATLGALRGASVKTFIVTGDHPATAQAIARELGMATRVVTGAELDTLDDAKLERVFAEASIFARISPSQKLRLVEALKRNSETVAVIGDGVNDAPALKAANVGIAMGEIGTDLAKEASDLVLTDDNYVHIVEAIGISRSALDNFRKGLTYYLTAKGILLSIFLVPLALGIPFPFAPIHIILTELLMDLASSTIFVTEAPEPDVLRRGVRKLNEFLGRKLVFRIITDGVWLAMGITALYLFVYYRTGDTTLAQTTAFVTWLLGHILLALNLKQEKLPLTEQGFFSNRFGAGWLLGMVALSLVITEVSFLHSYLKTSALSVPLWIAIVAVVIVSTFWIEVRKHVMKRRA